MHVERKKVGGRERRKRGGKCDAFLKRRVKRSQEICLSRFPHGGQVGGESSRGLACKKEVWSKRWRLGSALVYFVTACHYYYQRNNHRLDFFKYNTSKIISLGNLYQSYFADINFKKKQSFK